MISASCAGFVEGLARKCFIVIEVRRVLRIDTLILPNPIKVIPTLQDRTQRNYISTS